MGDDVKEITEESLKSHPQFEELLRISKVLFKTGNSRLWEAYPETFNRDYVGIITSAAQFLAGLDVDLIGIDYLSIAPFTDTDRPHQILLANEVILLEAINLTDVPPGIYDLFCLPLNIVGCEGSPARVILVSE
jgi:arylformamidase